MAGEHREIADAAETLTYCMAAGEALIAAPDQTGSGFITGTSTESAPPWNQQAAAAVLVPHAGVRALENQVRDELGLDPVVRGGSSRNTREALRWMVNAAGGLTADAAAYVTRKLTGWNQLGLALQAVDQLPAWLVIDLPGGGEPPDCCYCHTPNLRHHRALGVIACLFPPCPATDGNGGRAWAQVQVAGGVMSWRWLDGTVQP